MATKSGDPCHSPRLPIIIVAGPLPRVRGLLDRPPGGAAAGVPACSAGEAKQACGSPPALPKQRASPPPPSAPGGGQTRGRIRAQPWRPHRASNPAKRWVRYQMLPQWRQCAPSWKGYSPRRRTRPSRTHPMMVTAWRTAATECDGSHSLKEQHHDPAVPDARHSRHASASGQAAQDGQQ